MNNQATFWAQWRHLLTHAHPLYWALQSVGLVVVSASAALFWLPGDTDGVATSTNLARVTRMFVDALLLFGGAHVAVRPVLRHWFVGRNPAPRYWVALAAWLMVLSCALIAISYLNSALLLRDGLNFQTVQMSSSEGVMAFDLSGLPLYLLSILNTFSTFVLWVLLYLAFKAFQSRRQLQAQLREARVRQLTHQLNPHFLFNTFNTIRGMIFEDRERAAQLVTQLSELFRFHLSHELRTEQTLAEEWALAERYLDVESVRLESRLRLKVDLAPDCMQRTLPSLTLLTLVENAIKHGIAPNPDGGELRVSARCRKNGWQLEVGNSVGPGAASISNGTGLANLRERLALTLGAKAQLHVHQDDQSFTMRLEMPA